MSGMDKFGDWLSNPRKKKDILRAFRSAKPFEYVVINGFWNDEFAEEISREFPDPGSGNHNWHYYHNPIEHKYALNDFSGLPTVQRAFEALNCDDFIRVMREITYIWTLHPDPLLHGAGLHAYPRGGKLDMHLDYCIHPITGMERRLNVIVYMNKEWSADYGGELHLGMAGEKKIISGWNTAIIFDTGKHSYHGVPRPIMCPEGEYRKSMAIYYVAPPQEDADVGRKKAEFFPLYGQPVCDKLRKLYEIRKSRLICEEDLADWPEWEKEGAGYW